MWKLCLGYAIEYDCLVATQLSLTLETKAISGLYSAGKLMAPQDMKKQAQGLIAGIINALKIDGNLLFCQVRWIYWGTN